MITPQRSNTPLRKYPHLVASDILIWDVWIRLYGHHFEGFSYDIHVGEGLAPDKRAPYPIQQMWTTLTQKRIDVVGFRPTELWLIEVKDRATVATLGQILSYLHLFNIQYRPVRLTRPVIIAGSIEPDIETILSHYCITWYDLSDGRFSFPDPHNAPKLQS